jgi:hypothetical protein
MSTHIGQNWCILAKSILQGRPNPLGGREGTVPRTKAATGTGGPCALATGMDRACVFRGRHKCPPRHSQRVSRSPKHTVK